MLQSILLSVMSISMFFNFSTVENVESSNIIEEETTQVQQEEFVNITVLFIGIDKDEERSEIKESETYQIEKGTDFYMEYPEIEKWFPLGFGLGADSVQEDIVLEFEYKIECLAIKRYLYEASNGEVFEIGERDIQRRPYGTEFRWDSPEIAGYKLVVEPEMITMLKDTFIDSWYVKTSVDNTIVYDDISEISEEKIIDDLGILIPSDCLVETDLETQKKFIIEDRMTVTIKLIEKEGNESSSVIEDEEYINFSFDSIVREKHVMDIYIGVLPPEGVDFINKSSLLNDNQTSNAKSLPATGQENNLFLGLILMLLSFFTIFIRKMKIIN